MDSLHFPSLPPTLPLADDPAFQSRPSSCPCALAPAARSLSATPPCFSGYQGLKAMPLSGSSRTRHVKVRAAGRRRAAERDFGSNTRCEGGKVKLKLKLDHQVQFGEHHALVGSAKCMGSWKNRVTMNWTESGWELDLEAKGGERVEYKYVIVTGDGNIIWEGGPNRFLDIPKAGSFELVSHWDATKEVVDLNTASRADDDILTEQTAEAQNGSALTGGEELEASTSFVQEWQGREISFMRSNEHARERVAKWDTTGLDGSALQIVEGDRHASNWWRKVEPQFPLLSILNDS